MCLQAMQTLLHRVQFLQKTGLISYRYSGINKGVQYPYCNLRSNFSCGRSDHSKGKQTQW